MNLLEVNSVCKTYGEGEIAVHALREVNFSAAKGWFAAAGRVLQVRDGRITDYGRCVE